MQHRIHFTLLEARNLLILIIPALKKIQEFKKQLDKIGYDVYRHQYFGGIGPNGDGTFPKEMEEMVIYIKWISEKGVQIKSLDSGLIDFPHKRENGEEVYLCYMLGEDDINFWHTIEEGFHGRKAIELL